jgi:hypothetical protein
MEICRKFGQRKGINFHSLTSTKGHYFLLVTCANLCSKRQPVMTLQSYRLTRELSSLLFCNHISVYRQQHKIQYRSLALAFDLV